jgi:teichuronic acid biosynthesis glycosyltransferase TuaH
MRIVLAAHSALGGTFVVGSHHLARELARAGHTVAHVSTPITPAHLLKHRDPEVAHRVAVYRAGGVRTADGVLNWVPMGLLPWPLSRRFVPRANPLLACAPRLGAYLAAAGFDRPDALIVDQPKMVGIERLLRPVRLVYRATDLYAQMLGDPRVLDAERALCRQADVLIGTSTPVVEHLRRLSGGRDAHLVENGVEFATFADPQAAPAEYAGLPRPIAVYVGALDDRFDGATVAACARATPQATYVLIGPEDPARPLAMLDGLSNVVRLGRRPYDTVPAYLQHADLSLLPLSAHPANAGRSPMKLYEYGAAGLSVVASHTPELERRALPFVHLARESTGFVDAVRQLVASVDTLAAAGAAAREISRDYDWAGRARLLLSHLSATER